MSFWRGVAAFLAKDWLLELRSKETFLTMTAVALLVLLVFVFALEGPRSGSAGFLVGVFWAAMLFGAVVGLGRSFAKERQEGRLLGMLMAPVDRGAIFVAKWLGMVGLLLGLAAVAFPAFLAFFDVQATGGFWRWGLLLVLVAAGMAGVGVLLAALAAHTRAPDLLLPVLLFPLLVPLLLGAVNVGRELMLEGHWQGSGHWLRMMVAYDLIFAVVPYLLFEYVVEV